MIFFFFQNTRPLHYVILGNRNGDRMRTLPIIALLAISAMAVAAQSVSQTTPAAQSHDLQSVAESVAQYFRADPSG